jgi:hypothetical protein
MSPSDDETKCLKETPQDLEAGPNFARVVVVNLYNISRFFYHWWIINSKSYYSFFNLSNKRQQHVETKENLSNKLTFHLSINSLFNYIYAFSK